MGVDILDKLMRECYQKYNTMNVTESGKIFCEFVFDGMMCWPPTEAGTLASQFCPEYFIKFNSKQNATKQCHETGKWYVDKQFNRTWTNYSQCWLLVDEETALINLDIHKENLFIYQTWLPIIKIISRIGYGISLTALIFAVNIFLTIKKLHCARNRLHTHLFVSFIMRGFMSILKDTLFFQGVAFSSDVVDVNGKKYITENYNWICKAITSFWHYFIIANYMLILMEGIYLHNLIFITLFSDNSQITVYYVLGWGLPLLFIIPWIVFRINYENIMCWTTSENYYYAMLIQIPIIISIIINFMLFIVILRVLFVKLNSMHIQHRTVKYRRLARSTLILIPLFGVAYTLSLAMSYTTTTNAMLELLWIFFDQIISAFQGFFVALIYCWLNSEVRSEIIRKFDSLRERQKHIHKKRETMISHVQYNPESVVPSQENY